MAIILQIDWDGITSEQYDRGMQTLDLENDPPPGLIFHAAAFDDDGAHVTDVWESAEDFQVFARDRLAQALADAGVAGMPPTVIRPAHNVTNLGASNR